MHSVQSRAERPWGPGSDMGLQPQRSGDFLFLSRFEVDLTAYVAERHRDLELGRSNRQRVVADASQHRRYKHLTRPSSLNMRVYSRLSL